jgi:hypothetical protein
MYPIEIFSDKVPYVDSGWDPQQTINRVPAGAVLASRSLGDLNPALELAALLAGGTVALAAHGTKATARLAINASPEPFSNWFASISEDLAVLGGIWMIFNHPIIMLILVLTFLALLVWLIPKLYRLAKQGFQAMRSRMRGVKSEQPPPTGSPQPG